MPSARPLRERLLSRLIIQPNGCLVYSGCKDDGYGRIHMHGNKRIYTHVLMYELFVGRVPKGMQLDHLCRNRACANVAHLEPLTPRENGWRGQGNQSGWSETSCPQGHAMPENAYVYPNGDRRCRPCHNEWQRQRQRRSRERASAEGRAA